ncbi:hypothetical protein [Jiangella alba]|uniref:Uncharacterized protein n=1 Tax=Jiangella alba TaxID=561176 RepID=A0A1H5PW78_9ACTN|nr:hypothetical protein [Jiangella alba]SEF17448.1 hypothetical protein SAMN04488561_5874 [Jiangella alba]
MSIETTLRSALEDVAADALPVPALAATALRRARRRRTAVRSAVAAGAVAAVAVPAGVLGRGDDDATGLAVAQAGVVPAPGWRELTADEVAAAVDACYPGPGDPAPADEWDAVHGIRLTEPASPTWVISESGGERRVECTLPAGADGAPLLRTAGPDRDGGTLMTDDGLGAGSYADPVTRVTVQYGDRPEQEAVLWDGLWFDPLDHARLRGSCEGPLPYVVRGYDEGGRAVTGASFDVEEAAGPALPAVACPP